MGSTEFQFTHPGRGATRDITFGVNSYLVSIHAPREGCDDISEVVTTALTEFQFTHPGRGATTTFPYISITDDPVSIHAPREGCDFIVLDGRGYTGKFQFTHPGRGATCTEKFGWDNTRVSIHAPREGCDCSLMRFPPTKRSFNSRTPGGVRPSLRFLIVHLIQFQFTHPGRGAT